MRRRFKIYVEADWVVKPNPARGAGFNGRVPYRERGASRTFRPGTLAFCGCDRRQESIIRAIIGETFPGIGT